MITAWFRKNSKSQEDQETEVVEKISKNLSIINAFMKPKADDEMSPYSACLDHSTIYEMKMAHDAMVL